MDNRIVLKTSRLILREFILEDAIHMFELNADPEIIRFTGDEQFKSLNQANSLIQNYDQYKKYGYGRWTVIDDNSSEYLGWCGLNYNNESDETDLGFRFKRNVWGKGVATEAANACIDYGFNQLKLSKIIGRAMKENTASIRVLEKTGMRFEKEFDALGGKCIQFFKTK